MQPVVVGLYLALFTSSLLLSAEEISAGCQDWILGQNRSVCCRRCKPGNRLVMECGPDPEKLCAPCHPNTYTVKPMSMACSRCTQCSDPQFELKACNTSTDTVCGCKPGLRCGDNQCKFCVDECGKGEEPTPKRSCRKCPEGTFNDKIHSSCKPWTKSCPEGQILIAKGDAFSDIKCSREVTTYAPSEVNTVELLPVGKKTNDQSIWPLVGIFGGASAFIAVIILSLWLISRRTGKSENKTQSKNQEFTVMMVDHEEPCSFHQPEQEKGGSSESLSTQNSESKLIL
ncbi:tumor necrosis factor receptor superfamily member 9a [Trichomycterus rosablanca]|uniref:tumor necrosis factor receptor superfamily member 9a n=1 Tax=Trichomycterus rosablanca TaxID=2290929 RepID=UPI002F357868